MLEPRALRNGQTRVADKCLVPFGACAPKVGGSPPCLVELRVAARFAEARRHAESQPRFVRRPVSHVTKDKTTSADRSEPRLPPLRPRCDISRLNHDRASGILSRAKAIADVPGPRRGLPSARVDGSDGPVEQRGVLATLSRWRSRVQIPSGPLRSALDGLVKVR